ncbi:unnamed protein product [Discosporangium mesarthrocarpum]
MGNGGGVQIRGGAPQGQGGVAFYVREVTFVVESLEEDGGPLLRVNLDCSGSQNAVGLPVAAGGGGEAAGALGGREGLKRQVEVPPGEVVLLQHLVPLDPGLPWCWMHEPLTVSRLGKL